MIVAAYHCSMCGRAMKAASETGMGLFDPANDPDAAPVRARFREIVAGVSLEMGA